jgi:hypothetical protein
MRSARGTWTAALSAALLAAVLPAAAKPATPIATVQVGGGAVRFAPLVPFGTLTVTLTGPGGVAVRKEFTAGQSAHIVAGEGGVPWLDGQYRYELRVGPAVGRVRDEGEGTGVRVPADHGLAQSGGFRVLGGMIVSDAAGGTEIVPQFLIAEDLYVQGRACIGTECVNAESLTTTLRLKELNTRILFEDTSVPGSGVPANDWQITVNDATSLGLDKFSIDDVTGATTPFTIEAGADTNALYVDANGRLGLRTATPVRDLHLNAGDTPGLRLEQIGGVFLPYAWDVRANELAFTVNDVNQGTTPLRIQNAASTFLDIGAGGVGIGRSSSAASLHVSRSDGSTQVLVENTAGPVQTRRLLDLQNNGGVRMRLSDNSTGTVWAYQNIASEFLIDANGGANEFLLTTAGNLTISGTLSQNSDRNLKTAVRAVDAPDVLEKVAALPITTWQYKADEETVRHVGPMAQDFAAAFGVGANDRTLAPGDVAGVALAAIQALRQELTSARHEIAELRARHAAQAARLAALEGTLGDVRPQEVHQVLDGHRLVEHGDAHP